MNVIFEWIGRLFAMARFFVIVRPWERCIRLRLGHAEEEELATGFHWCIPFLDETLIFNTRLRLAAVPNASLTTSDGQSLSLSLNVWFRNEKPLRTMMSLQQPEDSCAGFAQELAALYVESRNLVDIDREELRGFVKDEIGHITDGLVIERVGVSEYVVPDRTFRIINNEWRPQTRPDVHDVTKMDIP